MWWWIAAIALLAIVVAALLVDWRVLGRRWRRDHVGEAQRLLDLFEHAGRDRRDIVVRPSEYALRPVIIVRLARSRGLELVGGEPGRPGSRALSEPLFFRSAAGVGA